MNIVVAVQFFSSAHDHLEVWYDVEGLPGYQPS